MLLSLTILAKYTSSKLGWYDEGKLSVLESISGAKLREALISTSAKDFLHQCASVYFPFALLTATSIVLLVTKRKISLLIGMLLFMAAYFLSICMIYPSCDYEFYIESEWMCIALIPALPLLRLSTSSKEICFSTFIGAFSFCWSLANIYSVSDRFRERIITLEHTLFWLQNNDYRKVAILKGDDDFQRPLEKYLMMDWGMPVELLFLSKIYFPNQPSITAVCMTNERFKKEYTHSGSNYFLNSFYAEKISNLDKHYFPVDTSRNYKTIEVDTILKVMGRR